MQEALKATLYELKLLKMNTINVNKFNEEIEKKADYDEMKKLMEVLSSALGDLMGKNVSAAAKSRCLMCDKPVASAVRESTRGRSGSPSRSPSRTESQDRNAPNRGPLDMANNNKYDGDATHPLARARVSRGYHQVDRQVLCLLHRKLLARKPVSPLR